MVYIVERYRSGVYALVHSVQGVVYVGSSARCIYNRLTWHMSKLRAGTHPSGLLQQLFSQDPNAFSHMVLEYCDPEEAKAAEKRWCARHETLASRPASGYHLSEETRLRQRIGRDHYLQSELSRKILSENAKKQHREGRFGQRNKEIYR